MHETDTLLEKIRSAVSETVSEKKIGIAFSGGVDSSVVAKICSDMNYDVTLLTIGFAGSHDI
ncbi:MAG TPA: asparagine synthase-related protein, partial [Candidatus Nitrosotenuis sp.]|nr:asparagine synthase-related protein [Candidatus Nitrosotenuis sp.]